MELKTGQFASRIMGCGGVKRLALSIFLHLNADLIGSYANDPNLWIIVSESSDFFSLFQSKPIMHLLNFYIVGHCEGTVWGSMAPPKPKQAVSQMWGGQHTQKNKHT